MKPTKGNKKLVASKVKNPTNNTKVRLQKLSMKPNKYIPTFEDKVDEFLGYPMLAAHKAANMFPNEDPQDNVRHALAGMYTAENIKNKTGNIPLLSKALGFIGSTGLGAAHEASTFFDPKDDRSTKIKLKEAAEDMYNNTYGAYKGAYGKHGVYSKKAQVMNKALSNQLPDGRGEERPFKDNPKWTDPYDKKDNGTSKLKSLKNVYRKAKPYIKRGLEKASMFLVNDVSPKLPSGRVKDHIKGLGYGVYDIIGGRKFSETFPITKAQKEKVNQAQQKAYDEGLKFSKDWYYNAAGFLRPEVREKIAKISPGTISQSTNLSSFNADNPIVNTPGHLISTRKGRTVLKNTSKVNERYFKRHTQAIRGDASGVHHGDAHLTFKNHGFFAKEPKDIMNTAIHEHGGHSGQQLGVSQFDGRGSYNRTPWAENIADRSSGKPLANTSTELGKKMKQALSEEDWYDSPLELHAELMPLRKKMYDTMVKAGLPHEDAMDKLHNPSQATLSVMASQLGKHFKSDTPHSLKKEIIQALPAIGGIGVAGAAAQEKKNGAKLIKYKEGSKGVSLAFSRGEKDPKGGLTQKGVDKYNRATGGNLKMAVTTPPSKLKAGSKAANRRKSFCARMSGVKGPMTKPNGEPSRKALALRKWNC